MHTPKRTGVITVADEDGGVSGPDGLDHSAAMLRAESDHLDATLRALATRLSAVPGLKLTVTARQGLLRRLLGDLPYLNDLSHRRAPIHKIVVQVGPTTYRLGADHGSITCGWELAPGEPGESRSEVSFAAWATTLFDDIAAQNLVNHESMVALRRLV